MSKRVVISVKRENGSVITERVIIDDNLIPQSKREWDIFFEELDAVPGCATKVSHPMDLATDDMPLGPYYERFP